MPKRLSATEQVTIYAMLGEQLIALVRESGVLKPKRRAARRARKTTRRSRKATEAVVTRSKRGKALAEVDV